MKIGQVIYFLGIYCVFISFVCFGRSENNTTFSMTASQHHFKKLPSQSFLQPSFERVFSRRRRFLLLPKGGALKFTVSMSKRLLAKYPRGFNLGIEAAVYYPAFTTRMDLLPKRFRTPTTTTPKPIGPTKPLLVYIPGTELRYKAKPAPKTSNIRRISNDIPVHWIDNNQEEFLNRTGGGVASWKYGKYANIRGDSENDYENKYDWVLGKRRKISTNWPIQAKHRGFATNTVTGTRPLVEEEEEAEPELPSYRPIDFPALEPYKNINWRHFHGHRDRRQLFHGLEGLGILLGFDMKACILRTICESKRILLPVGYSMLHDMVRVVFTVPNMESMNDEYSRTSRTDYEDCEKTFQKKCSISLLNMFLNPVK